MFPVRIEGPRIKLREFLDDDWIHVKEYTSDPEVVKYELWGPNTVEQDQEFIRKTRSFQRDNPRHSFELAITLKVSGKLIGGCGIRIRDTGNREGDIGYVLRRDEWGKGLGTEVARALLDFSFQELKLHRIWATCHVDNAASARVLEKAGMQREGLLRKNKFQRGVWRDSFLYARLESD